MARHAPNWLQQSTYPAANDRDVLGALWPAPASSGAAVTASSGMTVNVAAGRVAIPTNNNTGTGLCTSDATEQVTLAAAPGSGSNRIDLVVAQLRGNDIDGGANNDFIYTNVTGTAAATPTVPATPANAVALAQVYVAGGSASVTAGNITDVRPGNLAVPPTPVAMAGARAFRNAAGTVGQNTTVVLDSVSYGTGFNTATGVYTVAVAGPYLAAGAVAMTSNAVNQSARAAIARNGAVAAQGGAAYNPTTGFFVVSSVADIVQCNLGDTLSLWNTGTAGLAAIVGTSNIYLSVRQLA